MSNPSEAYKYGVLLGAIQGAYERMFQEIGRGMADALAEMRRPRAKPQFQLSPPLTAAEAREHASIALYKARVAQERRRGLAFVDAAVRKARRDLGLPS